MSETRVHNQRRNNNRGALQSTRSRRCLLPGRAFFRSRSQAVLVAPTTPEPPVASLVSDDELPSMSISPAGIAQLLHAPEWNNNTAASNPLPTTAFQAPYVRDDVVVKPPSSTTPTRAPSMGVVQNRRGLGTHKNPRSFSERRLHVPASWNPDRTTVNARKKAPPPAPVEERRISISDNPASQDNTSDSTTSNCDSSNSSMDYHHHNRIIHHPIQTSNRSDGAPLTIEVAPGQYLPLRGAVETTRAIQSDFFRVYECWGCSSEEPIFVIQDANHAICPRCDAVTPIDHGSHDDGYGHGVGLGFTFETLKDVRRGVY